MKLELMTVGLLTSALTLVLSADTRAADVRVGVGVQFGGGHDDGRYYNDGRYNDGRNPWQYGYARGRDEGYKEGEKDARRHERFSFHDEKSYRDCDRGYKGWMGPRPVYERGYRRFARWDGNDRGYDYDRRYDPRYDRNDRYDR